MREELTLVQHKHQALGQQVAQLEEENKHLDFMVNLSPAVQQDRRKVEDPLLERSTHAATLKELGFTVSNGDEEEEDEHSSPANSNAITATPQQLMAAASYDIPAHLKTTYNLVRFF